MSLEERWLKLVSGETRGPLASAQRAGLTALSALYWLGLKANLGLYSLHLKPQTRPALPTISVGNLTVGGTGKSTAVRLLSRMLLAHGVTPGVVLRGHRREGGAEVLLASDGAGNIAAVEECGDEAAEIARAVPEALVGVGRRRERVIELLAERGAQVAILDDGFQYFRMARDLDVALISANMPLQAARLLPRGIMREPWRHLRRADQIWMTHTDLAADDTIRRLAQRYQRSGAQMVCTEHEPKSLTRLGDGATRPLDDLKGLRVLAVSGLGSPESFEGSLQSLGAHVTPLRFPDHHRYEPQDWERIAEAARDADAVVVTTEKDAVKFLSTPPMPVWVLRSELHIVGNPSAAASALRKLIEKINA